MDEGMLQVMMIGGMLFGTYKYYQAWKKSKEEAKNKETELVDKAVNWYSMLDGIDDLKTLADEIKKCDQTILSLRSSKYITTHPDGSDNGIGLGTARIITNVGFNEVEMSIPIGDDEYGNTDILMERAEVRRAKLHARLLQVYEDTYSYSVTKTVTKTLSPKKKWTLGGVVERLFSDRQESGSK